MNVIDQWRIATKRLSETDSIMKNIIETYNGEKMKLRGKNKEEKLIFFNIEDLSPKGKYLICFHSKAIYP